MRNMNEHSLMIALVAVAVIVNVFIKFFVAWVAYHIAVWMALPEWATIALVAIGAAQSGLSIKLDRWSAQ